MALNKQEILLDSGTNELEIVKFEIGSNQFGINVMKVREIIQPVEAVSYTHSPSPRDPLHVVVCRDLLEKRGGGGGGGGGG
ncbi:hypothetical protein ACQ4LK_25765, partial [Bacillus pumilus]